MTESEGNASILNELIKYDDRIVENEFEATILGSNVYKKTFTNVLVPSAKNVIDDSETSTITSRAASAFIDSDDSQWISARSAGVQLLGE